MNKVKFFYTGDVYKFELLTNEDCSHSKLKQNPIRGKKYTIAVVYDDVEHTIKFGLASCLPSDNFVKRIGRAIAEKNAYNNPIFKITNFNGKRSEYQMIVKQYIHTLKDKLLVKAFD